MVHVWVLDVLMILIVFGATLVMFSMELLFILNVVLLTAGPLILLLLVFSESIVKAAKNIRRRPQEEPNGSVVVPSCYHRVLMVLRNTGRAFWRSANFWLALLVGAGLQALLVTSYVKINPFVRASHSHQAIVPTRLPRLSIHVHIWCSCQLCRWHISPRSGHTASPSPGTSLHCRPTNADSKISCSCTSSLGCSSCSPRWSCARRKSEASTWSCSGTQPYSVAASSYWSRR